MVHHRAPAPYVCRRASSICLIWSLTSRRRSMSRCSSASVLGGIGSPSGVRKSSRRPAAFFSLGLKPRMPSRINAAFIRLTIRVRSRTRLWRSRLGRLASSSGSRDRHHLAVISLAAQPAEKGALEQLGVETVGLGAPVLARYGYARCVDDVGLDAACPKPARQPETVTAGFKGDGNAFDPASCFLRLLTPAIEQLQQCALVDCKLLQRLTLDARHDAGNEPARQTHFDHRDQCAVLFQEIRDCSGRSAFAWGLHRSLQRRWMQFPSPPPHSISKRTMRRPTRQPFRGRLIRLGEMSEVYAQTLRRGSGGSMYTRKAHETREAPKRGQRRPTGGP